MPPLSVDSAGVLNLSMETRGDEHSRTMSISSHGEAAVRDGLELARSGVVDHDLDAPAPAAVIISAEQRLGLRFL